MHSSFFKRALPALAVTFALAACGDTDAPAPDAPADAPGEAPAQEAAGPSPEQLAWWDNMQELCGMAFANPENPEQVMHVRQCFEDEMRIPVHMGEDRSRTWIVTQEAHGLRLKHDHREEDGSESEVTQYGGDTEDGGTPNSQDFHADEFTAELIPPASTNIWTMEIHPDDQFIYTLVRVGTDHGVVWPFDLTNPVAPPPAPWGYEDTEATH
jgi:hypothetical protein